MFCDELGVAVLHVSRRRRDEPDDVTQGISLYVD